jgi:hypothetical protein
MRNQAPESGFFLHFRQFQTKVWEGIAPELKHGRTNDFRYIVQFQ